MFVCANSQPILFIVAFDLCRLNHRKILFVHSCNKASRTHFRRLSRIVVKASFTEWHRQDYNGAHRNVLAASRTNIKKSGFYVSVVNAMLIHDFSDNSLRKIKTDKADSLKIAHYGLTFWETLNEYSEENETRRLLKMQSRLYERTLNTSVMLRNGLIALLDQSFPNANKLFKQESRNVAGHMKWVDFVCKFWHKDCVATVSKNAFTEQFRKWCKRTGYRFSLSDAETIYAHSKNCIATLNKNNSTKILIKQAAYTFVRQR